MIHYDTVEWKLFKEELLDKNIKKDMEDHLLECDHCMEIFLTLIDEELENVAKLSEEFTENVMGQIRKRMSIDKKNEKLNMIKKVQKKKNTYNELLVYYVAVASVAIFLTGSGFFTSIVSQAPDFGGKIIDSKIEVKTDIVYNFSKSITNSTSSFVRDFNLELKEKR